MSDPRLQQLASEAARKIKAVASDRDNQIQEIYQQYQQQAASIRAEVSVESLRGSDTDQSLEPYPQHQTH